MFLSLTNFIISNISGDIGCDFSVITLYDTKLLITTIDNLFVITGPSIILFLRKIRTYVIGTECEYKVLCNFSFPVRESRFSDCCLKRVKNHDSLKGRTTDGSCLS